MPTPIAPLLAWFSLSTKPGQRSSTTRSGITFGQSLQILGSRWRSYRLCDRLGYACPPGHQNIRICRIEDVAVPVCLCVYLCIANGRQHRQFCLVFELQVYLPNRRRIRSYSLPGPGFASAGLGNIPSSARNCELPTTACHSGALLPAPVRWDRRVFEKRGERRGRCRCLSACFRCWCSWLG